MKILVVSNLYPPAVRGGYEVECAGVVEFLRSRGDEVRVLTSVLGSETGSADPLIFRELPLLPLTKRGVLRAPLGARRGSAIARSHLERFRPDLVFVWNGAQIPHSAIHTLLASGTPTAFRVCEQWFGKLFADDLFIGYLAPRHTGLERLWSLLGRAYNRVDLRLSTSVAAPVAISWVSEFLRSSVSIPLGLNAVLERTIPATTQNASEFLAAKRVPPQRALVTFVGRLSAEKGPEIAIRAAGVLAAQGTHVEVVFAGPASSEDRRRLEREADRAGIRQAYTVLGTLRPAQLAELLSRSSVLVVPSVWPEPMGIVLVEGALARVPIVASRVGGIPEVVGDDEAILVPPSDPEALAEALRQVLDDPDAADRRAGRAYERAQARTWDAYTRATAAFVDDAYAALA